MPLLFLRNVGGMGAGDVSTSRYRPMAGTTNTLYAFAATAIVGGIADVIVMLRR